MATSNARRAPPRTLPKLHLIYFFLAFCDLLAVMGGLFLSHRLNALFDETMAANRVWDARLVQIEKLGESAFAVNGPVNDVFESKNLAAERARYADAEKRFQAGAVALSGELEAMQNDGAGKALIIMQNVRSEVRVGNAIAAEVFKEFEGGDIALASAKMAQFDFRYSKVASSLSSARSTAQAAKDQELTRLYARAMQLKQFEWLIGGFIALMVLVALGYGSYVGRVLVGNFKTVERAREQAESDSRQLLALNDDVGKLNRVLADNFESLKLAQDEIVRKGKLAQLGQLTATVAHEIRNPLSSVRTAAFLIRRKTKDSGLDIEPQLQRIGNGVDRCDGIISQLLDFARSNALQLESLVVDEWVAKAVQEEAERLPIAVTVECELGLGDLAAAFDPARMRRVIVNLVSNASEALVGRGDDASKFTALVPRIEVKTTLGARGVEIAVADNGPGIAPENLARVLEPLFTTKSFGTGLGLPAVQKILEHHGGGLDVASKPGKGARFTAWFPVAALAKAEAA